MSTHPATMASSTNTTSTSGLTVSGDRAIAQQVIRSFGGDVVPSLRIELAQVGHGCKVFVDDLDISALVSEISVRATADQITVVQLTLLPRQVTITNGGKEPTP